MFWMLLISIERLFFAFSQVSSIDMIEMHDYSTKVESHKMWWEEHNFDKEDVSD